MPSGLIDTLTASTTSAEANRILMAGEGGHGAGEVDGRCVWSNTAGMYSPVKSRHGGSGHPDGIRGCQGGLGVSSMQQW